MTWLGLFNETAQRCSVTIEIDDLPVITLFNYVSTFARRVNQDLVSLALRRGGAPVLNMEGMIVPVELVETYASIYVRLGRLERPAQRVAFDKSQVDQQIR